MRANPQEMELLTTTFVVRRSASGAVWKYPTPTRGSRSRALRSRLRQRCGAATIKRLHDTEFPHTKLQGCYRLKLHAQTGGRPAVTAHDTACLAEHFDDVIPLGFTSNVRATDGAALLVRTLIPPRGEERSIRAV